jgi:hypothetical protein
VLNKIYFSALVIFCGLYGQESPGLYGQASPKFKAGLGLANGFGGIGVGIEAEMHQIALLAGLGSWGTNDLGWDVGLRYYLGAVDKKFRPNFTISYGPTAVVYWGPLLNQKQNSALLFGPNILAGLDHDIGKPNGFVMTYGIGFGIPGDYPSKMKDDYQSRGQSLPSKPGAQVNGSLGIKYVF